MCSRAYDPSWSICCMALPLFGEFYSKQNCSQFTNVLSVHACAPYNNHVCVRMCVCVCMSVLVSVCPYVCICVHACPYVCICVYACPCVCVHVCIFVCTYLCDLFVCLFKHLQLTNSSITIFSISVASSICCLTTLISLSGTSCLQKSNYINTCNKFISVIRESTNLSI